MIPAEFIRQLRAVAGYWAGRTDAMALHEVRGITDVARDVAESGEVNELMLLRLRRYRRRALCYGRGSCDN